jgi:hypothetical protein
MSSSFAFGLDNQLLLISKGSLFTMNLGVWYRPSRGDFFENGFQLGALIGPSFSSGNTEKRTSLAVSGEVLWNQRVDEMVYLRVFLRGGRLHSAFLAQTGLSIVFDFR